MTKHRPSPVRRVPRPCLAPRLTSGGDQDLGRLYYSGTGANPEHTLPLVYAAPNAWRCGFCGRYNDPLDFRCPSCQARRDSYRETT